MYKYVRCLAQQTTHCTCEVGAPAHGDTLLDPALVPEQTTRHTDAWDQTCRGPSLRFNCSPRSLDCTGAQHLAGAGSDSGGPVTGGNSGQGKAGEGRSRETVMGHHSQLFVQETRDETNGVGGCWLNTLVLCSYDKPRLADPESNPIACAVFDRQRQRQTLTTFHSPASPVWSSRC